MMCDVLSELRQLKNSRFHSGATLTSLAELENSLSAALPDDHKAALRVTNGLEVFSGYFRLFGVLSSEAIDAVAWNHVDTWKFAWAGRCSGFWCFGETAWGDQYAYNIDSLRRGGNVQVYFLEALAMTPQVVADSFAQFLENELVRVAREPYGSMTVQASRKFGPLDLSCHLAYVPSLLLGGIEDVNNVQKMDARSAMIINGDIAVQLDAAPVDKSVSRVQAYEDSLRRSRLRLLWV